MAGMTLLCRNATIFAKDGSIDEEGFRGFLQRFVDCKLGMYLGSGGSGEGHALTHAELDQIYRIGVAVGRGKVQVNSNQPEQNTARDSLEHALIAARAGIDVINIYGPEGRHHFVATDEEYIAYFDHIFASLKHPTALCPNPTVGYLPKAEVIAAIAKKHSQVVAINLSGIKGDAYFIRLKDALGSNKAETYVAYPGALSLFALGATGILGAEANVIPKTFRRYIDAVEAGKPGEIARVYAQLRRFSSYIEQWNTSPRWIKMSLRVFKQPGGEGGLREPFLWPAEATVRKFTEGLLALDIPEVNDMARQAGIARS